MRRVAVALLLALTAAAFAVTPEDFQSIVDTEMSTPLLFQLVQSENYEAIDPDRYFLLDGSVASITVLDPNPDTYQALIELVDGEWVGMESISVYRVYVLVIGPEFAERVPARLPRDPGPEVIMANQELLVVGNFIGVYDAPDGTVLPVVQAILVRN